MSTTSTPVQKGWDNHFAAFGAQDVEKILEDYTEDSQVMVWDTSKNEKSVFKALAAPLIEVEEDPGNMVFLVWECPSSKGYTKVTDTFIFKGDKILRQNIVVFNNV